MARPVVDLPQPDSPTSPSVSPRRIENETPSTARTAPTLRWKMMPCVSGKCITSLRTSSRTSAPVALGVDSGLVATATAVVLDPCRVLRASSFSGSLGEAALAAGEPAGGLVGVWAHVEERRHFRPALVGGVDAPRVKRAVVGQVDQVGRQPLDRHEALLARLIEARHA